MKSAVIRPFDQPQIDFGGHSILITGGTGSFGQACVRHLLDMKQPPRRLVVFSRDEQKQDAMQHDLRRSYPEAINNVRFFIGDVRDISRLELAMHDIDIVIHAAALKIIPVAEYNPFECILTNVHGAENVVKVALRCDVERVIALSTDKAANPINLYGASKLAADRIMVAANNLSGRRRTRFAVVRYGNVIGSRGSVVPLYRRLVEQGVEALPITDPRMTRFWISLGQGVNCVLSSLAIMRGGELFVPKIPSMRLTDLAHTIAPGLAHETVGIRPGEKLHEVMVTEDDARMTLELHDRYVICPNQAAWSSQHLQQLGAKPVGESFRYSSDLNPEWLDADSLTVLLERGIL